MGSRAVAADTAVEYAELNYDDVVVPTITESAQPLDELETALALED